MPALDYAIEKFRDAVYDLAIGEGDARSRVGVAYLRFWGIRADEFPEQVRAKRAKIDKLLTRLSAEDGQIIPENLRRMKNSTASKIAELIVDIYMHLVCIHQKTQA